MQVKVRRRLAEGRGSGLMRAGRLRDSRTEQSQSHPLSSQASLFDIDLTVDSDPKRHVPAYLGPS